MATPFHKILSKTDRAITAYIIANASTAAAITFPAKRSLDKPLPNVVVYSESFTAESAAAGTCVVKTSITVKTSADLEVSETDTQKPRKDGEAIQAAVFDLFYLGTSGSDNSALADAITAAARALAISDAVNNADLADFKCDEIMLTGGSMNVDETGSFWMDALEFDAVVRPSTDTEP